jgi:hypothetical protein
VGAVPWLSCANANVVVIKSWWWQVRRTHNRQMCNAPRCGAERARDDGLGRRDGDSVTGAMDEGARWIIWM